MTNTSTLIPNLRRLVIALIAAAGALLVLNPGTSSATTSPSYPRVVFSDGFESGDLTAWDGTSGSTGTVSVTAAGAHSGNYGARLTDASGQYVTLVKRLPRSLPDSSVTFWARVSAGGGLQTLAQARDQTSTQTAWWLVYDGTSQGLYFYPYNGSGTSTEIFTGANSVPTDTWVKIEVRYTATSAGGAQLYVNGQTNAAWGVSGDYTRTNNFELLQLWNDSASTTDLDDVTVAAPPLTAPAAPTGVQGAPRDSAIDLNWTAPFDGGTAITGYRVTTYLNGVAQAPILTKSASPSYSVTGLSNGKAYTFTVAAINSIGTGPDSAASAGVSPVVATTPGAPTGVQATPSDSAATVTWTAPASNGGTPVTGYQITPYLNGTAQTPIRTTTSATSQYVGDNLTNGSSYTFTVVAINSVGAGPASSASAPVTPVAATTPYTHAVFTDGFESGGLTAWSGTDGSPGSVSVVRAAAHLGAWGARLTNQPGQYALLVAALPQPLLDSSVSFWARVSPGGGIQTLAEARDQSSRQVAWAVLFDGSHQALYLDAYTDSGAVTQLFTGAGVMPTNTWVKIEVQYTATSTGGAQLYVNGQTQAAWGVTGDYTRTNNIQRIQLWNDSASTTDFDNVRVAIPTPGAPTGVSGTPGDGAVALSWTAPTSNGGYPLTGYQITPYINGVAQAPTLTNSTSTSYTLTGLKDGTAYTFKVAAVNVMDTGPGSAASAPVTPVAIPTVTPPGAPTGVQGSPRDSAIGLNWTAPASDGGSPITGYRVTPYLNGVAQAAILTRSTSPTYTVSGLRNGTAYTFTVAAINSVGTGPESVASAPVSPVAATTPGAPTGVQATASNGAATVSWTAPASDGGTPIIKYQITPYMNGTAQTPITTSTSATSQVISGLTSGASYTFTVEAINSAGAGPASTQSAPVIP